MAQYRTDRNPHDLIFAKRALVHFAVDPHRVAMTTRLAGDKTRCSCRSTRLGRRRGSRRGGQPAERTGYQTAYLWEQVWQRDAWLDLLGDVRARRGRAACCSRASTSGTPCARSSPRPRADGAGVDRLVQHSAGSGKSNTIAWTAHSLSRLHGDGRPADLRQGRGHHRPPGPGPAAAGDRRRPRPHARHDRAGRPALQAAARRRWRATRRGSSSPRCRSSR